MGSTYLTRTQTAGNRKTWTWSAWVKRGIVDTRQTLLSAGIDGNDESQLRFDATGYLRFKESTNNSAEFLLDTDALFRDPAAWYNIVVAVDTTQSTDTNRIKIYVNGSQITSFNSPNYPSQNYDTRWNNNTQATYIGQNVPAYQDIFDGYMAHVHFTDGYAYTASSFGSTATNGQWVPILTPSVTYGTNGYFLKFTNGSDLGEDFSGNNNDFTKTGSGDKVLDSPANVFSFFNSNNRSTNMLMKQGNLKAEANDTDQAAATTIGITGGKWYFEFYYPAGDNPEIGLIPAFKSPAGQSTSASTSLDATAFITNNGGMRTGAWATTSTTGLSSQTGESIIGVAVDANAGKMWFTNGSGTFFNSGNPATGSNAQATFDTDWLFQTGGVIPYVIVATGAGNYATVNFGQDSSFGGAKTAQNNADGNGEGQFYYTVPSGYLALCTNNLSSSLTLPIGKGGSYMNTLSYTGSGATRSLTGVGFQPDFTWIKESNNAVSHRLFDSIRGATKRIFSNNEDAESTQSNALTSFDSDGFSLGDGGSVNGSSDTYAAWNWRASGSSATNNNGSVTTTVSANTTSGFSVVGFTSPGSGSYTLGHGLSSAPDLIIYKCRGASSPWWTFFTLLDGSVDYVKLNDTTAKADDSASLAVPTSTVFSLVDNYAPTSQPSIAYCFHSVEGFSKIGKYPGNGSSNGPFVYTGFRPSFILMKSATSGENWLIYDDVRDPHNVTDQALLPNLNSATGGASNAMDMYSNGFKLRSSSGSVNNSGQTYIYLAFARNPFVDSSGIPVTAR